LESGSIQLPGEVKDNIQTSRYASWVILQYNSNKYFILNTHLAAGIHNEYIRIAAVSKLITEVQYNTAEKCLPVILGGDLNSKPFSAPIRLLTANLNLYDSYLGIKPTVNAWERLASRLDYVLYSEALKPISVDVVSFRGIAASDHLPLIATFSHNITWSCQ
jgi:endonuclease/exonuclease/phosphatase family metal-dependent hydrolase